jgi:hypothetical protein
MRNDARLPLLPDVLDELRQRFGDGVHEEALTADREGGA